MNWQADGLADEQSDKPWILEHLSYSKFFHQQNALKSVK